MPYPRVIEIEGQTPLAEELDLESRLRVTRPGDAVKGMFFTRYVDTLRGAGVGLESAALHSMPASGRYLPFTDYPLADYFRIALAAGRVMHPDVASSEQLRRAAATDFQLFTQSRIGRVMLAFTSDTISTLAKCGPMYRAVIAGPVVESERVGNDRALVRFREYRGPVELYPIGTIEGVCHHFRVPYRIRVQQLGPHEANYEITVLGRAKH